MKIAIISSSVRDGRQSHKAALFLRDYISRMGAQVEILDLKEYDFPLFKERLYAQENPSPEVLDFAERFRAADGVVIVSPVYNASFPAALKNVIDLLVKEWAAKPVCVVSATSGTTPGIATVQELQALMLKLGARVAAPLYTVIKVDADFTDDGTPADQAVAERFAAAPIKELMWLIEKSIEQE